MHPYDITDMNAEWLAPHGSPSAISNPNPPLLNGLGMSLLFDDLQLSPLQ
ncbi:MAG: hypothetical protein K2G77_07975 [Muribaculaceae bacterium]|nr:hypothetical protein [Muribaculaceae bacterium]